MVPGVGSDLVASIEGIRDHIGIIADLSVIIAIDKEGDLGFTGDLVQLLQQLASELVRTIVKGDGNGAWRFAGVDLGIPCSTLLQRLSNGTVAVGAVGGEGAVGVGVEHGGSVDEDGGEEQGGRSQAGDECHGRGFVREGGRVLGVLTRGVQ